MAIRAVSRKMWTVRVGWGREIWIDRWYWNWSGVHKETPFMHWRTKASCGCGVLFNGAGWSIGWANARLIRDPNYGVASGDC